MSIIDLNSLFLGLASRLCDDDPAVWHDPNVENCSTVEIVQIKVAVNNILAISRQNLSNSDLTLAIEPEILQNITNDLATVIDKNDTSILPNDLDNVINTVGAIIRSD